MKIVDLFFAAALSLTLVAGQAGAAPKAAERPSILTWTPAQQAYGYRHMEKFAPARRIAAGGTVFPLPKAKQSLDLNFAADGRGYSAAEFMAAYQVSGLLVIKDGQVVLERYGMGRKRSERWTSFSVAKSVTSTLIGAAVADGKIKSLDDPVTAYIPQLAGGAYEGVSVRQLITMTSGVKWNEDYSDPHSDVAQVGLAPGEPGMNPVVSYMRRLPRAHPPGSTFLYNTGETDLAGILVSNAVGMPMAQYLSQKIWKPFGMGSDAIWVEDTAGHERGGCCISMTLRDYGRMGMFLLGGGVAGGHAVLPPGWVEDATSPHVKSPPYGYFWWLKDGGYAAEGIFGQMMAVFPKEHLVVVINSAWPEADPDARWATLNALLQAVRNQAS